jgi:hypothetical protein
MFSDALYTFLQPYLWLGNVLKFSDVHDEYFDITIQIFYISNTLFALSLLYAIKFFQQLNKDKKSTKKKNKKQPVSDTLMLMTESVDGKQLSLNHDKDDEPAPKVSFGKAAKKAMVEDAMLDLYIGMRQAKD